MIVDYSVKILDYQFRSAQTEELWPYIPRKFDFLTEECGHKLLYSVKSGKIRLWHRYATVIEIGRILGLASIFRNPGITIPEGALTNNQHKLPSTEFYILSWVELSLFCFLDSSTEHRIVLVHDDRGERVCPRLTSERCPARERACSSIWFVSESVCI